jgi:hypothetical protein
MASKGGSADRGTAIFIDFPMRHSNTESVRRASGFLLLMAVFFAGSGLAGYLHELDHLSGRVPPSVSRILGVSEPGHDESACSICLNLHAPALAGFTVALLICVGIFVAFLTQLAPHLVSQRALARIDCRGPPRR